MNKFQTDDGDTLYCKGEDALKPVHIDRSWDGKVHHLDTKANDTVKTLREKLRKEVPIIDDLLLVTSDRVLEDDEVVSECVDTEKALITLKPRKPKAKKAMERDLGGLKMLHADVLESFVSPS